MLSEISIPYLIRHAPFILIVSLHLLKMVMPTGEHCWKKNSGASWAQTSKSNALPTALPRKICEVGF